MTQIVLRWRLPVLLKSNMMAPQSYTSVTQKRMYALSNARRQCLGAVARYLLYIDVSQAFNTAKYPNMN